MRRCLAGPGSSCPEPPALGPCLGATGLHREQGSRLRSRQHFFLGLVPKSHGGWDFRFGDSGAHCCQVQVACAPTEPSWVAVGMSLGGLLWPGSGSLTGAACVIRGPDIVAGTIGHGCLPPRHSESHRHRNDTRNPGPTKLTPSRVLRWIAGCRPAMANFTVNSTKPWEPRHVAKQCCGWA